MDAKHNVDIDWLVSEYHNKRTPVSEIARHIGCRDETVYKILDNAGIDRRVDIVRMSARAVFDVDKAISLYVNDRLACNDIGDMLGVHGDTVRRRIREAGVRIRHHNETKKGRHGHNRIPVDEQKLISFYKSGDYTLSDTGKEFSVSVAVVQRVLNEGGIERNKLRDVRHSDGRNNPNWKDSITDDERNSRRDAHKQAMWRKKVYHRDGFTCVACGDAKGGNLNAHHIEGHSQNKSKRWELGNGATMCVQCHRLFHRTYGLKDFGLEELNEFLNFVKDATRKAKGIVK